MQAVGSLAIAPMFPDLVRDFDSNLADVIDFNGITILVLGFSNFLWYSAVAIMINLSVVPDVFIQGTVEHIVWPTTCPDCFDHRMPSQLRLASTRSELLKFLRRLHPEWHWSRPYRGVFGW